ncbi:hypothetical protein A3759_14500 [Thalassolituus sp. HI0120]|nr:hypothetical protein A3759_14500 [Thalassolituus sp. HI0120]
MALFSKYFKPKWQHDNPEVRRKAIADLKPGEQLLSYIDSETVAELRQLAIARISDEQELDKLLSHSSKDVREMTRKHWLQRLLSGHSDFSQITDNNTLIRIASLTDDQQQRLQAIEKITDQQQRLILAMKNPVAKVRLAAAEGIDDTDKLQQLMNYAQGKDKAIYRLCKDRLNAGKAEREAQQALLEKITGLLANVQQLNRLGYNPEFNGRFQVLSKDWSSLQDAANAEQISQINTELAVAAATLQQHAEEEIRQAALKEEAEQAHQQQQSLLIQLQELLSQTSVSVPSDLHDQITSLEQNWSKANNHQKADTEQRRQFENQLQQLLAIQTTLSHLNENQRELQEWLERKLPSDLRGLTNVRKQAQRWQKQLQWPTADNTPEWVKQITKKLDEADTQLQELAKQQQSRLQTIDQQLVKLEKALDEGHAKDASKINQQLIQNLRQVDNKVAASQQRLAKALAARLNEMRDWQGFATTPKKEALCQEMEALVDANIDPADLAEKIHDLQDQWKALGSSQPDKELWQRFQAAGDKAFDPCREYFAEQAKTRLQFIEARRTLTSELRSYEQQMDWASADWKVVQKTLDAARETFRSYSPVDRAAHKDTQNDFHAACDAIYAHLKAEYDRNLNAKQALTEQAQQLIEQQDLSAAIESVKQLQQNWKNIGVTPRNPDQKLWKQFRSHCDAIFARLDNERAQRKAEINDAVVGAEALIKHAEALLAESFDSNAAVSAAQTTLAGIKQQFSDIELPKSAHQRLLKKLQSCEKSLNDHRQDLKQAAEKARWNGLIDRLQAIAAQDHVAFEAAGDLPAGYQTELFIQAMNGQLTAANSDAQAVVIAMEVLAEVDSPASDKSRRMELQVQKLAQGIGNNQSKDTERQQLVEQWLNSQVDDQLQSRFINALKASL